MGAPRSVTCTERPGQSARFRANDSGPQNMQFLMYLTVLMVAISTVLLEVHWLAAPEPQPKPALQTSAPAEAPKTEGSNAEVRRVYPKNTDASRPLESDSQAQTTTDTRQASSQTTAATSTPVQQQPASTPQSAPSQQSASTTQPSPPQQPIPAPSTQPAPAGQPDAQQSRAETTGAAVREENRKQAAYPANSSNRAENSQQQATLGSSHNRCDILACAGNYRSFRANDCTYQPFDGGARRLCEKTAGQRIVREREQPDRRKWSGNAEVRYLAP
jgi:BA14K-like protein